MQRIVRSAAALALAVISLTASPARAEVEDGSAAHPWLVYDLATLDAVRTRNGPGVYFKQVQDIDASATGVSGSPWNNGGLGWLPIANMAGEFDGNGHVISGLFIDRADTTLAPNELCSTSSYGIGSACVGLFGVSTATLKNIALRDVNIAGGTEVGALAGEVRGPVSNSSVTGSVRGVMFVGGLVGDNMSSTISGCTAVVTVTGQANVATGNGSSRVGGLVGVMSNATLKASTSSGSIVGGGDSSGGLVGSAVGAGTVIEDSSSSAEVNVQWPGTYTSFGNFGGLVGSALGGRISRCYASGRVTAGGSFQSDAAGGLVGGTGLYATTIEDSHAAGDVTVSGGFVGGLVGYAEYLTVARVSATGNASGSSSVGGLIGASIRSTFTDCYARGTASGVAGLGQAVGGLAGITYVDTTITACYAIGAARIGGSADLAGGLIGVASYSTIVDSYWDVTASGNPTSNAGDPRSTEQLQTQSTYGASWNFSTVWYPPSPGVYPMLR